jgi:hypothetical protein
MVDDALGTINLNPRIDSLVYMYVRGPDQERAEHRNLRRRDVRPIRARLMS